MTLPSQEKQDTYTNDEVQHIVAREVMRHRLGDLEAKMAAHEESANEVFAEIRASLKTIDQKLSGVRQEFKHDIDDCRKEFREEVQMEMRENYTHQKDMVSMESRLEARITGVENKVDRNWLKVTTAVGVVYIAIEYGFKLFGQ